MRILFCVNHFLDGGVETILLDYLNHLAAHTEHELTLCIAVPRGRQEAYMERLPTSVRVVYLTPPPLGLRYYQRRGKLRAPAWLRLIDQVVGLPLRHWYRHRRTLSLAQQHDVVIDFHGTTLRYLQACTLPIIVWRHGSIDWLARHKPHRLRRDNRWLSKAAHIVTISQAMLQEATQHYPAHRDKLCRIYNGIDLQRIAQSAATPNVNVLPPPSAPYIVSVARLDPIHKDFDTLLRAYALLCERLAPETTPLLYIVGKGKAEFENHLRQLADQLGILQRVRFVGFQANPYPWIAQSQLLVHSSRSEGFGLVLAEAMMLNVPCVCTDCPTGPNEVLNQGKAGMLVPVGNAEAMAEAMQQLLTDDQHRQSLLTAAQAHRENFLVQTAMQRLEQLLYSTTSV